MSDFFLDMIALLDSTARVAAPLVFAALAGLFSERAGIIDIGLEGKMLFGAFAAGAAAAATGSPVIGLAAAIGGSVLLSLIHGYAVITHRGEQVVSGLAINIIAAGLAPTLANAWFGLNGQTPLLEDGARFGALSLPGVETIGGIPLIGPIYAELISGHSLLTWLALLAIPAAAWLLFKSRFGLRLRAAGENPEALDTAGVSVFAMRYRAVMLAGLLCGLGGAALSTALSASFVPDMTAGKGYLALAAMIFGKWRPVPTLLACLLFAFADAAQARLQATELPLIGEIPVQFIIMLPYVLTVLLLAGFVGRAQAPKASGKPYVKEG